MGEKAAGDGRWHFWIDRGGTFTDIVARSPEGRLTTRKLLSENPEHYEDAVLQGIRDVLGLEPAAPLPRGRIACIKMGTTVATNALLERRGEPTVWVTTRGLGDMLRIGYQQRPDLFALNIVLPAPVPAHGDGARLMFMQSNGGLTDSGIFRGKDSILSGPAGGVVAPRAPRA